MTANFRVERVTSAPASPIYDLLADASGWRNWAPLVSYSELIRPGTPDRLGTGAIRRIGGLAVLRVDEEILEARPPHYQHYTALRGIPVSRYSGKVCLTENDGATQFVWTGTFEPRIPGTGRVLAMVLGLAIATIADRAIAIAERAAKPAH